MGIVRWFAEWRTRKHAKTLRRIHGSHVHGMANGYGPIPLSAELQYDYDEAVKGIGFWSRFWLR